MDVTCERCRTEYEFEDTLISPRGTRVRCTNCGHIFRVFMREASVVRSGDESKYEWVWRIRTPDGRERHVPSLGALQKLVASGQVRPEDEVSRGASQWKRIGEIPEFATSLNAATTPVPPGVEQATPENKQSNPQRTPPFGTPIPPPGDLTQVARVPREPNLPNEIELDADRIRSPKATMQYAGATDKQDRAVISRTKTLELAPSQSSRPPGPNDLDAAIRRSSDALPALSEERPSQPQVYSTYQLQDGDVRPATGSLPRKMVEEELGAPQQKQKKRLSTGLIALFVVTATAVALVWAFNPQSGSTKRLQGSLEKTTSPTQFLRDVLDAGEQPQNSMQEATSSADAPPAEASPAGMNANTLDDAAAPSTEPVVKSASKEPSEGAARRDAKKPTADAFTITLNAANRYLSQGNKDLAEEKFRQVLALRPGTVEASLALGRIAADKKNYALAVGYFDSAYAAGHPEGLAALARTYRLMGKKNEAIDAYREFLSKYPQNPMAAQVRQELKELTDRPPRDRNQDRNLDGGTL